MITFWSIKVGNVCDTFGVLMSMAGLLMICSDCNKYLKNDFIDANRRAIVLFDTGFFISLLSISDSRNPRIDSRFTLSNPEIFLGKKAKNLDKSFLYAFIVWLE